jgi:hypothetical protein
MDESWKCAKVLDYCEEEGMKMSTLHKWLVEWGDLKKSQLWVNFFALSLNNPIPIISFERNRNFLDKMPFQHLIQSYKARMPVDVARIQKVEYKLPKES